MEPMRWIRGLVPLAAVALMGAGTLTRPTVLAASDPPWIPPPCPHEGATGAARNPAWYRLDATLDGGGTLAGQRLSLGVIGGVTRIMDLPTESFATGPHDGRVLVGTDDGSRSRLSLVDPVAGCATVIGDEAAVIRSALVAPDGAAVLEHRVARTTRSDLGVWRRPLDGGPSTRQLPAPAFDARYGRTFTTELRWTVDGTLAVSSCGILACRTTLLPPDGGTITTIGPTGEVVGVSSRGSVIAYAPCGGSPCPILEHDRRGGLRIRIAEAGRASMAGDHLVFEHGRRGLRVLDLASGGERPVEGADGLVPARGGSMATSGAEVTDGALLLVPAGRLDGTHAMELVPGGTRPAVAEEVAR